MDLRIDAKFLGTSVSEQITQQAQVVIQQEVAPVTPQFLIYEHTFTAEVNQFDLVPLPVELTTNMKVLSIVVMFDTDYPLAQAEYGTANVGNWDVGTTENSNSQFLGGLGMGIPCQSFRPLFYTPAVNEQIQLKSQHWDTMTTGLTGHKLRCIIEFIEVA